MTNPLRTTYYVETSVRQYRAPSGITLRCYTRSGLQLRPSLWLRIKADPHLALGTVAFIAIFTLCAWELLRGLGL